MSFSGQYIYICGSNYTVWRSSDFGATFTPIHGTGGLLNTTTYTTNNIYQPLVSYTGQYCVFAVYIDQGSSPASPNTYSFVSRDYGVTWSSPKLVPFINPSVNPALTVGTITHSSNGTPVRAIILAYNSGICYLDF